LNIDVDLRIQEVTFDRFIEEREFLVDGDGWKVSLLVVVEIGWIGDIDVCGLIRLSTEERMQ
jgi:hypothetical protein